MPIITLISDTGNSGYYSAAIKAAILKELPSVTIIDITHNIKPFHILEAAFVLRTVYHNFPTGTIHLTAVDAQIEGPRRFVALHAGGHYFVGADNGLFSIALAGKDVEAFEIIIPAGIDYEKFPAAGILAKTACAIAIGTHLDQIGKGITAQHYLEAMHPTYDSHSITTRIVYTDEYGNCFCNLDLTLFTKTVGIRPFYIDIKGYTVEGISNNYDAVKHGEIVALFSTSGLLELAISYGNLSQLLGLKDGDSVLIKIGD